MAAVRDQVPAIEAIGISKIYGQAQTEVVALDNVTLSVARGEVVALLGPNGAGKSTLLTATALINPLTTGRIIIGGEWVMEGVEAKVDLRSFRRSHLGFVFQKANLIPFLTALENVQIAMEINDIPTRAARQRVKDLLAHLGLGDRFNYLPDTLSSGQQQRVAVARALANNPNLILADEPTAALKVEFRQMIKTVSVRKPI